MLGRLYSAMFTAAESACDILEITTEHAGRIIF
jgi:hypothetical protein